MKMGTISRSLEQPNSGFDVKREGFSIYAQYIPEDSIHTIFIPDEAGSTGNEIPGHTEYEYTSYSFFESIDSYEELISKLVLFKYTLEDEMSLINKMIANESISEYTEYRTYVALCKTEAKNSYIGIGLNKIGS